MAKGMKGAFAALEGLDPVGMDTSRVLVDDDQQVRDELAAWGAGLSTEGSPMGALGRALGSQLEQRNKQRELEARYMPIAMQAITNQREQALKAAMMQGAFGGGAGGLNFQGMPIEQVARLKMATGVDFMPQWEAANIGKNAGPGSYNLKANPDGTIDRTFNPDPNAGVYIDKDNRVSQLQGAAGAQGNMSFAKNYGERVAQEAAGRTQVAGPGGTPGLVPNPTLPGSVAAPGAKAPPMPFDVPTQGVPAPAGPGNAAPAPAGGQRGQNRPVPGAPGAGPGAAGRPVVAPAEQAGRDSDAVNVIKAEIPKTQQQLVAASQAFQAAQAKGDANGAEAAKAAAQRALADLHGMGREITRLGGKLDPDMEEFMRAAGGAAPAQPGRQLTAQVGATKDGTPPGFVATDISPMAKQQNANVATADKNWLDKTLPSVEQEAGTAKANLEGIGVMRGALAQIGDNGQGWGADYKQKGAQILGALGVENADKAAASYENFNAAVGKKVWKTLNDAAGPQTEGDFKRAKDIEAQITNRADSNRFQLDLAQAQANRQIEKARYYRQAYQYLLNANEAVNLTAIDNSWKKQEKSIFNDPIMRPWMQRGNVQMEPKQ